MAWLDLYEWMVSQQPHVEHSLGLDLASVQAVVHWKLSPFGWRKDKKQMERQQGAVQRVGLELGRPGFKFQDHPLQATLGFSSKMKD